MVETVVNHIFNSITYIIPTGEGKDCFLVDCGDVDKVVDDRWIVKAVLLTHAHFDHIYGLPLLLEKFPDVVIYTNEWGKKALADDRLNMSRYHESPFRIDCPNVTVISEEDRICGFDVYETPGHNPSCLCYANNKMIFTGDAYIPGCKVVTNLRNCDKALAEVSVTRILELTRNRKIYAGHKI